MVSSIHPIQAGSLIKSLPEYGISQDRLERPLLKKKRNTVSRSEPEDAEWRVHSKAVRSNLKIGQLENLWALRPGTRGTSCSSRQRDVINVAYAAKRRKLKSAAAVGEAVSSEQVISDLFVDTNVGIQFKAWGTVKGICARSSIYSFECRRYLHATEHLDLLGYDACKLRLDFLTDADVRDLAGNAHHLLQAAAVMHALALSSSDLWEHPSNARADRRA